MRRLPADACRLWCLCLAATAPLALWSQTAEGEDFKVPAGFTASLFADDALAHDIFSMTFDPRGLVVVSGPGYIKTLHDDDGDGVAERASLYSPLPKSGAQGLCFSGTRLLATGDGALLCFTDADHDQAADGPPETWARLRHPEHGAHAVVQGPDGWYYVVCGNDTGVADDFVNSPLSPVARHRCGAILRISSDGSRREIVAHGFRNPYDVDFTPEGNLLTVDSDGERDQHLPWYEPTRMFDVAQGMEHGWLEGGWTKSWSRPECFFDNVDRVCEFGRGSPTGLVVYRHRQFPEQYRGGVFAACWTFGRVYFVPLAQEGSTIRGTPEVFAAAVGNQGFAPVDLAVSPAGELFVAIGGRKTRGGVYRIRFQGQETDPPPQAASSQQKLDAVLGADQPLASWSRRQWQPLAESLGKEAFEAVLTEGDRPTLERIRAIEVLTELFGGLSPKIAEAAIDQADPALLARVAWALSRAAGTMPTLSDGRAAAEPILARLTSSESPLVQRAAWEALVVIRKQTNVLGTQPDWQRALSSADRRVRQAMIELGRGAGRDEFARWATESPAVSSPLQDTARLRLASQPRDKQAVLDSALEILERTDDPVAQLEALRLMQLALGDVRLEGSGKDVIPGYAAGHAELPTGEQVGRFAERLGNVFPMGIEAADRELARTLALLRSAHPSVAALLAKAARDQAAAGATLHYLFVLAHLPGPPGRERTCATADALTGLHDKLASRQEFPSRNWSQMVDQAVARLVEADRDLPQAIVESARFGRAEHALFLRHMPDPLLPVAARRLLQHATDADDAGAWTPELIDALGNLPAAALPADEVLAELREHWDDFRLRDAIARWMARGKDSQDRAHLVEALGSTEYDVVQAVARTLATFPGEATAAELALALAALGRISSGAPQPKAADSSKQEDLEFRLWQQADPVRQALGDLLRRWSGRDESSNAYENWLAWFRQTHPDEAARLGHAAGIDHGAWAKRLAEIDWAAGNVTAGQRVFEKLSCHRCHRGDKRLGPDLAGTASRMTRADLFAAIYDPQREVAPPYRTTLLATRAGQVYHGLVVYESPDGTLLQTTPDHTVRVTGEELLVMQPSDRSLMPAGLLDGSSDAELADLAAYLLHLTQASQGQ